MTINRTNSLSHWNYFLAIEQDLEHLARYVDLSSNDETFSIEIARLLLSACSEIEVVLKLLAQKNKPNTSASNINEYFADVVPFFPKIINFEVQIPKHGINHKPWSNWSAGSPPKWWTDHNKVKHTRHMHFQLATLKNCLNATGGLFITLLYLYQTEVSQGEFLQLPRLFHVGEVYSAGATLSKFGNGFSYSLP